MKKSLLQTNPYLADPALRSRLLGISVVSSTAIEGVHLTPEDLRPEKAPGGAARKRRQSGRKTALR